LFFHLIYIPPVPFVRSIRFLFQDALEFERESSLDPPISLMPDTLSNYRPDSSCRRLVFLGNPKRNAYENEAETFPENLDHPVPSVLPASASLSPPPLLLSECRLLNSPRTTPPETI
ncbi:hypothetical protein AVEN_133752-2-1, partial [Araneus ventricosus]